jgi:hypothetical protein
MRWEPTLLRSIWNLILQEAHFNTRRPLSPPAALVRRLECMGEFHINGIGYEMVTRQQLTTISFQKSYWSNPVKNLLELSETPRLQSNPVISWSPWFWPSRLGKSRIWGSKIWSWVLRDSDPRMTTPARASNNCKRHRGCYIRSMTARVQLKKIAGRESQGAWRQDEPIGGKLPVVKWPWLWLQSLGFSVRVVQ